LIEARPLTDSTSQIRAHLWHLGHPIVGDPFYLKNGKLGASQTLHPSAPPMCLHAHRLAFRHPIENKLLRFESPAPDWAIKKRFAFDPPE
jgi:23S rRNA-/tRNA-specific pseudouridylate synthase